MNLESKQLNTRKLIDATSLEGDKNEAVFRATEIVEESLSRFPDFISVFPFGSQAAGYNTGGSDLDLAILIEKDSPEMDEEISSLSKSLSEKFGETNIHPISLRENFPEYYTGEKGSLLNRAWREKLVGHLCRPM